MVGRDKRTNKRDSSHRHQSNKRRVLSSVPPARTPRPQADRRTDKQTVKEFTDKRRMLNMTFDWLGESDSQEERDDYDFSEEEEED